MNYYLNWYDYLNGCDLDMVFVIDENNSRPNKRSLDKFNPNLEYDSEEVGQKWKLLNSSKEKKTLKSSSVLLAKKRSEKPLSLEQKTIFSK